jgi:hypothetical protein
VDARGALKFIEDRRQDRREIGGGGNAQWGLRVQSGRRKQKYGEEECEENPKSNSESIR